tara:strand:+ start:504 stop:917 length:414 start_codon:yes stop_codon:yes gene_type:complete
MTQFQDHVQLVQEKIKKALIITAAIIVLVTLWSLWSGWQTQRYLDEIASVHYRQSLPEGWTYLDEQATTFRVRTAPNRECIAMLDVPQGYTEVLFLTLEFPENLLHAEPLHPAPVYEPRPCRGLPEDSYILTLHKAY